MAFHKKSLRIVSASSQYVTVANANQTNFDFTGDFCIEADIKLASQPASNDAFFIIGKWNTGSVCWMLQYYNNGGTPELRVLYQQVTDNLQTYIRKIVTLSNDVWYHIAVSIDADTAASSKFYVNASPTAADVVTSLATSVKTGTGDVRVGQKQDDASGYFNGLIKNVRVWSDIRTDQEILDNFSQLLVGNEANLIADWRFDGDNTSTTGNNTLTSSGSPIFIPDVSYSTVNDSDWPTRQTTHVPASLVSGSVNLTNFLIVIKGSSLSDEIYNQLQTGEINDSWLMNDTSLVAYYRLEADGSDETANNHDLTVSGSPTFGAAKFSNGVTIDANTKYLSATGQTGLPGGTSDFSMMLRIKRIGDSNSDPLAFYPAASGDDGYMLRIASNVIKGHTYAGGVASSNANGYTLDTNWHHVALVRSGSGTNLKLYIDGVLFDESTVTARNVGTITRIFMSYGGTDLNCQIDDVALLSRAVTADEIRAVGQGGADIRFTTDEDGATEVPFEIVSLDIPNKTSEIHVKLTLDYDNDTYFYVWAGNNRATPYEKGAFFGQWNVWSNFKAVYPLEHLKDSTVNALNLTNSNATLGVAGQIGKAVELNGSNGHLYTATSTFLSGVTGLTIKASFSKDNVASPAPIITQGTLDAIANYVFSIDPLDATHIWFGISNGSVQLSFPATVPAMANGEWHRVVCTWESGSMKVYLDGVLRGNTTSGVPTSLNTTSKPVWIGRDGRPTTNWFNGKIDQVEIITTVLSADWIATEYNMFSDPESFVLTLTPLTKLTKTVSAKALISFSKEQTISAKANIIPNISSKKISAKSRIKVFGIEKSITAKSRIAARPKFISAKARIYDPNTTTSTKIISVHASILPPQPFTDEIDATVRTISMKLEVQWDGVIWTDESIYLLSAQANEKMSGDLGEGIASTLDVEVDNTTERFTPDNTSSPLFELLKPRTNIRVSFVAGGYEVRMFTGYIKNIHPDQRTRLCSLECFDNQVLVYNKRANGIVYEDYRTDELLEVLGDLADVDLSNMVFDIGDQLVNFGYFEDRNVWPIMGEIAVAERGRVFFDRRGRLVFWNRSRLHNRTSSFTLTQNDWILDIDYSVAEHEIKNAVIVKAAPRANAGITQVWSSGNAEFLNPYTDTLVFIPVGSSQSAFLELEDPCTIFITPIANTDFTANSSQDGSDVDLTSGIEITEFINYGNAIFITVTNNSGQDAYLTKFQIRGNPVRVLKWIKVTATDEVSINRYGRQEFEVENNFITSEDAATSIADEELERRKEAINLFRVDIIGIPYLTVGDVVSTEYRSGQFKDYLIQTLDWTFDDGGFKQKLTLTNPYSFPTVKRMTAKGFIIQGDYAKQVQAKGNISA